MDPGHIGHAIVELALDALHVSRYWPRLPSPTIWTTCTLERHLHVAVRELSLGQPHSHLDV